jgi:hypothetical protein
MSKLSKPTIQKETKASAAMLFAEAAKQPLKTKPVVAASGRIFHAPEGHRRLTINLRDDLHKKLRMAAVERDCTATEIIEQLLAKELG